MSLTSLKSSIDFGFKPPAGRADAISGRRLPSLTRVHRE